MHLLQKFYYITVLINTFATNSDGQQQCSACILRWDSSVS